MRTFREFITLCEQTYDKEMGQTVKKIGTGVKVGAERKKTAPERRRMKAAGGGKMVPAKEYKARKDMVSREKQRLEFSNQLRKEEQLVYLLENSRERLLWRGEQEKEVLKHQQHHSY